MENYQISRPCGRPYNATCGMAREMTGNQPGFYRCAQRSPSSSPSPSCTTVSGGAAQAGESSYEAVLREVKEETGLDARDAEGGYLFTYKRENPGEGDNYFVDVYRFVMDVDEKDLSLQTEETEFLYFKRKTPSTDL